MKSQHFPDRLQVGQDRAYMSFTYLPTSPKSLFDQPVSTAYGEIEQEVYGSGLNVGLKKEIHMAAKDMAI